MDTELIKANESHAEEIWNMQKYAFSESLDKYQDFDTSPANECLEKVIMRLKQSFTYFYLIRINGKILEQSESLIKKQTAN